MGETLEALHRLQAVELKKAAIRKAIETKTRLVEVKRKNLRRVEEKAQENHLLARNLQAKLDSQSLEIAAREDSVGKHREALNRAKTNKEYAAILSVMNTEKADNTRQEADVFKLMEELQVVKNVGAEIDAERLKLLDELNVAAAAAEAFQRECQAEWDRLQSGRQEHAVRVLPGALSVFERVAERHEGEALAAVVKPFPKREEYACSGCNLKVPVETVNALRTRDDLQLCRTCGRILYVESAAAVRSSGAGR
jgi:predicted  nucleic acid-binding Zn-ribbon protein